MLVEIKERKTTHSKGKLLINWQIVCCTESHSLINLISLVQTLCSTNAGSMKIEEQVFEDTGLWDICIYLYLQCELKHINQHILTSKNTIAHLYIYIYTLFHSQTASIYTLCKHPHPQTYTRTSGLMDEEIDGKLLCPLWWMTSFGQCADHVCLKVESPFSFSLCLPLIFPACYASFPFESNSWRGPHVETPVSTHQPLLHAIHLYLRSAGHDK